MTTRFATEEGEEIGEVTAGQLRQVLSDDVFGKFAVLAALLRPYVGRRAATV